LQYLRISGEEGSHVDNLELPPESKENTDTDEFNCGSIPDEVDSFQEVNIEETIYKTMDHRSKPSINVPLDDQK